MLEEINAIKAGIISFGSIHAPIKLYASSI